MGNKQSSSNRKINKFYKLGKSIGQPGAFGHAVLATDKKTGETVAVKIINKDANLNMEDIIDERDLLVSLQHENLCRGLDYFEDKRKIYIVMEACSGGELFDQIVDKFNQRRAEGKSGSYSEAEAAGVLRQIFSGLQYMHERKIGHFDLKPDNFLFKDTQHTTIKIIDFGMSKLVGRTAHIKVLGGTLDYMAPEVIHTDYTYHADMWSMGVVTYVMLCGRCPFFRKKNDPKACGGRPKKDCLCEDCALCNRICEGKFSYPRNVPISEDAKDFISSLLQSDPAVRLTATEALSHPWLSGSASDTPLATSVLTDLQTMTQTSKLRTTLLEALSSDAFSDFEIKQLKASFEEMDADGDGKVSREEIKALQDSRPEFAQQLEQLLLMDVNGDGELDFEEILLAATQRKLMAKEDRIRNLFERLDEDGDGTLTAQEIQDALNLSAEEVNEMIAEVDTDGDGTLSYEEFLAVFCNSEKFNGTEFNLHDPSTSN